MPLISEQSFVEQMKQGIFLPCYLFYGEESELVKNRTRHMVVKILPKAARGFNLNRFTADNIILEDVENAVYTVPVMSEKRVVILDGIAVDKLVKADLERLKKLVISVPQSTVLIIAVTDPKITPKSCSKLRQLISVLSKTGGVVDFPLRTSADLVKLILNYAAKRGSIISKSTAYFLIERCGKEVKPLITQFDRLCAYAGGREITRQDILFLIKPNIENSAFDMTKYILRGDKKDAIIVLNNLIDSQVEPIVILGALNICFIDMYRAKCAQVVGKAADAITGFYNYKGKEFRVKNAMRDCARYSLSDLRRCIIKLSDVDVKCKTTSLDQRILIEKAIFSMTPEDSI